MRLGLIVPVLFGAGYWAEAALAIDSTGWCAEITGTPVLMCDDFDDYCPDPLCDDGFGDDTPDQLAFLTVWPSDGCHTEPDEFGVTQAIYATVAADSVCGEWPGDPPAPPGTAPCALSLPFAIRQDKGLHYPDAKDNNYLFDGTSHRHDLRPRIQQLDPARGSVNGTDDDPLLLQFVLDLYGDSAHRFDAAQANRYVELTDGSDRAPAGVTIVTCQDDKQRPRVLVDDGRNHQAVAIGMFAVLDDDPCSPEARPLTYRLSLYNGDRWIELKPGVFGANNPSGDGLKVGGHLNYVTMTIKAGTIDLEIQSMVDGQPYHETASAPRVYPGSFAGMHMGNGACLPSNKNDYVDDVALTGGILEDPIATGACCVSTDQGSLCIDDSTPAGCQNRYGGTYAGDGTNCATYNCGTPPGACCLPNGTCTEVDQDTCESDFSGRFQDPHTHCDDPDILCCPDPFADADGDGDVDQMDFAVFQRCYTPLGGGVPAGCECFDQDNGGVGDDDIDQDDLAALAMCASGPAVDADRCCDGGPGCPE